MANNKIIDLERLSRFKDKLDIELDKKANVDGNYPTMTVGNADNLTPYGENSGAEDSTPFVFQTSGGSSDVGVKAYLRELRGNSVAFNQLVKNGNFANTSDWGASGTFSVSNNVGTFVANTASGSLNQNLVITPVSTHKYLVKFDIQLTTATDKIVCLIGYDSPVNISIPATTNKQHIEQIIQLNAANAQFRIYFRDTRASDWDAIKVSNVNLFDLTQIFGAGNEPTSVVEFNRLFPKTYYEYNAGTLLSCKVNGIKNVGYNAFDGQLEQGGINQSSDFSSTYDVRSKNYIKVIPGQTYTLEESASSNKWKNRYVYQYDENKNIISVIGFGNNGGGYGIPASAQLGDNTHFIRFRYYAEQTITPSDFSDVAFHLTWDGSRTGYEPYEEWQYNLPNIELKSAGSAYDVLYSTGGGKRRIGVLDLGTITYQYDSANQRFISYSTISGAKTPETSSDKANIICAIFSVGATGIGLNNMEIALHPNSYLYIKDTSYSDVDQFKTAMSGVMLYYELATETDITEEENPGWTNPQDIDDFGTQEFLYDNDIDIPIPQGNDFFYPVDYKAFVDSLGGRDDIEYAADQVVSQAQLQNALSIFLSSIQGYDATKTQTLKNVSGVFQWVDD